jgi:hypothetical protein
MTWTEETYRIHGLIPEQRPTISAELIEFSLSCYSPEGRETIREAFTRYVEAGLPYDLRLPFVASNGSRLWVRTMAETVRDKTGRIVAVQGNIIEVTDQVNQEDHLRIFKTSSPRPATPSPVAIPITVMSRSTVPTTAMPAAPLTAVSV